MSRRLLSALAAILGTTLLAIAGGGTPGAAAFTAGHEVARAFDCLEQTSARVSKWAPNVDEPGDITAAQSALLAQQLQPGIAAAQRDRARGELNPGRVTVRTWVHVISTDRTPAGGNVSNQQINAQMRVLNLSFSGATGGAPTVFRFHLAGVTRTVKPEWSNMAPGSPQEAAAKNALHRGDAKTLNIYVVPQLADFLLGWSTLPDGVVEHTTDDGIVLLSGSLPGGDVVPYNEGDTATHEAGHWLALEHTFENGCKWPGDFVFDTPYEKNPAFGCPVGRNTCRQPGNDPIENFMDYTQDSCMHEFTPDQALRMWSAWGFFRG